jgi:hypothetical protein
MCCPSSHHSHRRCTLDTNSRLALFRCCHWFGCGSGMGSSMGRGILARAMRHRRRPMIRYQRYREGLGHLVFVLQLYMALWFHQHSSCLRHMNVVLQNLRMMYRRRWMFLRYANYYLMNCHQKKFRRLCQRNLFRFWSDWIL